MELQHRNEHLKEVDDDQTKPYGADCKHAEEEADEPTGYGEEKAADNALGKEAAMHFDTRHDGRKDKAK